MLINPYDFESFIHAIVFIAALVICDKSFKSFSHHETKFLYFVILYGHSIGNIVQIWDISLRNIKRFKNLDDEI